MTHPPLRFRKTPFATHFEFTVARLNEESKRVQSLQLTQVEYSCRKDPGLKAEIYGGNGQVTFYSRYCLKKRPRKERLGVLGFISLEKARQMHRSIRVKAAQGIDPRNLTPGNVTYNELHENHALVQSRARYPTWQHDSAFKRS